MSFLYAKSSIFIFHKKCSCPHVPCFCCCKKAELEEHATTCWRLEGCWKVSWLLLVSAWSVRSCIFSEKLKECLRVTPLERSLDVPQCPLWSLLHASGMGIHPVSIYYKVRSGMRRRDLSASVCDPNSEFSAGLFPKLICQWELYWSSSDALKNALWSTGVSCSSLQVSEVFSVRH